MKVWWNFIILAAAINAVTDGWRWYHGHEATWFTWFTCILFWIGVAVSAIERLIEEPEPRSARR